MTPENESITIILEPKVLKTLAALAAEDETTPENLIGQLILQEDRNRHLVLNKGDEYLVRTKCSRPLCRERKN